MDTITSAILTHSLRERMLQDMKMRGFGAHTQKDYIRHVRNFAAFLGRPPDTATMEDLRCYHVDQHQRAFSPATINGAVSALRFLFSITLKRPEMALGLVVVRCTPKLRVVLSVEETARLLEAAPGIKYKAALSVAYGAGLRVLEVAHLKVDDIDSTRMMIRVEQGKGRKDRNAMLSPSLLDLLRQWWREGKRRGVMLPHGWLFPGRNGTDPISARQMHRVVHEEAERADVAWQNKAVVYDLLFRAAADTMLTIAADPKHLGAHIGITAVLHTWGSALTHHPHVHMIVPGLPVAGACAGRAVLAAVPYPPAGVVHPQEALGGLCQPPFAGPQAVLAYLSRYTQRVAISNRRLIGFDEAGVTFRYKDYRRASAERKQVMTLATDEPPDHRPPCPCCGGHMIIIETFARAPPSPARRHAP